MKIREVIDKILEYHPYLPDYDGCDGYKSGNPEDECTGIALALVPTIEVIEKTIEMGCNLLIVHEPSYYMTPDFAEWKGDFPNKIYEKKRKLLEDNNITVWRDHDHIHAHEPDGIFTGVVKYLGWEEYRVPTENEEYMIDIFDLPEMTVKEMQQFLIEKISMNGLRYIGNPDAKIKKVAIVAHLYPNAFGEEKIDENGFYDDYSTRIIKEMEKENGVDAIIPGEIIEWNVLSYIRDAVSFGKNKACFNIGHYNWEELGMRYMLDWLPPLLPEKVDINYIPSGDIFRFK